MSRSEEVNRLTENVYRNWDHEDSNAYGKLEYVDTHQYFLNYGATFDIAENLVAPAPLESIAYAELKKMLKEHFVPKLSVIAWRHAFEQQDQCPGKSAADFIATLRQAAWPCEFKDLEERLRDRLVCGLRSRELQQKIFAKETISFQDALREIMAEEAAGGSVKALRLSKNPPCTEAVHHENVERVEDSDSDHGPQQPPERRPQRQPDKAVSFSRCIGCGGQHKRADCRFHTATATNLAQAYQQLPVDNATAEAQTIVTHWGAFKSLQVARARSSVQYDYCQDHPGIAPTGHCSQSAFHADPVDSTPPPRNSGSGLPEQASHREMDKGLGLLEQASLHKSALPVSDGSHRPGLPSLAGELADRELAAALRRSERVKGPPKFLKDYVILDQFNPSLRNFVTMGKNYQKALSGVTVAAKGYFDALVKLGELASDSQGSKELGDTLFQMAEDHRQMQVQLEETLKFFHSEMLSQLEHKLELDIKYLMYVEIMSTKQSELNRFVAEGYKAALMEERRRYSFLVDRQCAVSKHFSNYHSKVQELLAARLPVWQTSCTQPTRLPERALALVKLTANNTTAGISVPAMDPLLVSKTLEEPLELGQNHRTSIQEGTLLLNGDLHRGRGFRDFNHLPVSEFLTTTTSGLTPTQPTSQIKIADSYSCTLPMPHKMSMETHLATVVENKTLPHINPLSILPPRSERLRVQAIFSHLAGENSTLLNFQEGDVILLLVTEARDGWHYGENEATRMKGWFPFSYTRPFPSAEGANKLLSSGFLLSKLNSSSTGNLDPAGSPTAEPDGEDDLRFGPSARISASRQRPYSMLNPDLSQLANEFGSPSASPSRINPFAHVKLKGTVTNDRSVPLIQ
ncbi:brain-specific angiogenesis inhibitor 1-associated protein 2-like [Protobothrops mucrosquamatus]|uniref:brain-specific angiogenesis inhibitor 1-associated protein 2-like n=1 Tax=Protobothrops mucrosquamatus TaxID=103944 RepID=UPI0010FB815B|nr:brain-specific angiogenesis inhibitor 1-associated protein 2-like [Protobothrops mucrosquamatus]